MRWKVGRTPLVLVVPGAVARWRVVVRTEMVEPQARNLTVGETCCDSVLSRLVALEHQTVARGDRPLYPESSHAQVVMSRFSTPAMPSNDSVLGQPTAA